uniref:E3 ubiquitin-protein ligase n=1 Tax=Coptotermes formosanus TaxID=36987 RepID=R4UXA7_COPFO|nr:hypothetical protein [Coptotermes formosanus]
MDYYDRNSYYGRGSFIISGVTPATKYCKLIFSYNVLFYCCCEIQNDVFYAVLQYISPAEEAAKYQYKMEFDNKERTESLIFTRLARGFHENLDEIHRSGKCVKLYADQFSHFMNEKGEVSFSMEIIANLDSCHYGHYYD